VAVLVVDLLESVQVDKQQGGGFAVALAATDLALEFLFEPAAVPNIGQRIVVDEVLELGFEALAVGDVLNLRDEAQRPAISIAAERYGQRGPDQLP
jgi:hypothetical protein